VTAAIVPVVSGGQVERGHLEEFRSDPIALMHRVRDECGEVGNFQLAHEKGVLLSGAQASEFFFRAANEDLDPAEAYPFTPQIFGEGVGAASATLQINAIFSVLLREYEFKMAQPAVTYRNDHSTMVVQLERPAVEGALLQAGKAMI
jgi:cytochrome P450